jgi:hypothetical protein
MVNDNVGDGHFMSLCDRVMVQRCCLNVVPQVRLVGIGIRVLAAAWGNRGQIFQPVLGLFWQLAVTVLFWQLAVTVQGCWGWCAAAGAGWMEVWQTRVGLCSSVLGYQQFSAVADGLLSAALTRVCRSQVLATPLGGAWQQERVLAPPIFILLGIDYGAAFIWS